VCIVQSAYVKLLIFSDVHNDLPALERLIAVEADYYFAAGDLVSWGKGLDLCGEILKKRAEQVYVLPGNHESAEAVSHLCYEFGLNDFHGRSMRLGEYHVAGLGYSTPTPFDTPGEYSESEMAHRLKHFQGLRPLVLICHCPPYGTPLDRIREGMHGGSTAVREFLAAARPAHFFCGHIHEAGGVSADLGDTHCVNVGKRGYLLELE
jgi:Icc-related predicted phosphoesterase